MGPTFFDVFHTYLVFSGSFSEKYVKLGRTPKTQLFVWEGSKMGPTPHFVALFRAFAKNFRPPDQNFFLRFFALVSGSLPLFMVHLLFRCRLERHKLQPKRRQKK